MGPRVASRLGPLDFLPRSDGPDAAPVSVPKIVFAELILRELREDPGCARAGQPAVFQHRSCARLSQNGEWCRSQGYQAVVRNVRRRCALPNNQKTGFSWERARPASSTRCRRANILKTNITTGGAPPSRPSASEVTARIILRERFQTQT